MDTNANPPGALPDPLPTRINLGCGWDIRPGWLNVDLFDMHKPDLVADVTSLPMLPDAAFQEVLAQDVLEHLARNKVAPALNEWSRLLAPGGTITLRVPSLPDAAAMLSLPERQPPDKADEIIHLIYGTQAYGGDFHLSGYTFRTLAHQLAGAGLLICEARLRDQWLIEAVARKTPALRSVEERVHNRYVWIMGRPADEAGLAALSTAVRAGDLSDAALDNMLWGSDEASFKRHHPAYLWTGLAPPPPSTGPLSPAEADAACARTRTVDLLRNVRTRLRRKLLRR